HYFGVIEYAQEELRADLEGTLLLPRRSERAQDVGEPEHGVQMALEPDRGEGGAGQMGAHGAVGPEDESLLGDGGLGRRQLLRRAEEGPRSFRVEGSPCEVVERRWRLTKDAHAFRETRVDLRLGKSLRRARDDRGTDLHQDLGVALREIRHLPLLV